MLKLSIRRQVSVFICAVATATIGVDFNIGNKLAHASVVDLNCTGGHSVTYNPGLTFDEKETKVTSDSTLSTCVPLLSDPTIVSGSNNGTNTVTASCDLANAGASDVTYKWSNGRYSTVHLNTLVNEKPAGDTVTIKTGIVTDGEFKGDMATRTTSLATLDTTKCLTTGVTSANGTETIVFTGQ